MFRYLALMWDANCLRRRAVAEALARRLNASSYTWSVAHEGQGVRVFVADPSRHLCAYPLEGSAGVVVGEIFERQLDIQCDRPVKMAVFGERETYDVLASEGRILTTRYWGNYVAFVMDAGGYTRWVVKDPTGNLPCYVTEHRGVRIFFSCLGDCRNLGCLRFTVNWMFVRKSTVNGIYDVETNPFTEISNVHRGECVQFDARGSLISRCFYWHPLNFPLVGDGIEDAEFAGRALRSTVRSVVHSLAAHHTQVLQQISGGLDSSIVLGCLRDAPSPLEVTCYTDYVPDSSCDERRWARYATEGTGFRHVEVCCDPKTLSFAQMPVLAPSVEPASCFTQWQQGPVERRLAAAHGASATFTGEGGDSTFGSTAYVLAVDASLRRYGLGCRTLRTAIQVAARRDRTVWQVLAKAVRRRIFETHMAEHRALLAPTVQLVSAESRGTIERQDHFPNPWFSSSDEVPLEILARLGTLAFHPKFYDLTTSPQSAAPYSLSPLCAQPVVELAARIPMDIHFDGGRIRGLARRAFSREVPEPILRRQWKDRPFSQVGDVIHGNLKFIRDTLLDGVLIKERILNRAGVELALSDGPSPSRALGGEILRHLDLELWIRQSL